MPKKKKESKNPKKLKKVKKPHVKPTQEELKESIKKTAEEAEALKDKPEPTPSPSEPSEEPSPSFEPPEEEPAEPTPSPEVPSPSPSPESLPEEPSPSKAVIKDVLKREKEKKKASAQEAQVLHARSKKITEALEKAREIPEPTDEEMEAEHPDWDMLTDFEKKIAKETLLSNRRFAALDKVTREFKDSEKHQKKINDFLVDPKTLNKYPGLEGRGDEFRVFATKPTRRGLDFEDLVPAFLYTMETNKPAKKKGKMFPTGTGGPVGKPKTPGKISIEDAIQLRKTDSKKYKELMLAGKIDTSEL